MMAPCRACEARLPLPGFAIPVADLWVEAEDTGGGEQEA
jgi:hypothetical protein